jgi:exosome complex exonuclease DIS3/RRP44
MNRAVHGDQVAIILLPKDEWDRPESAEEGEEHHEVQTALIVGDEADNPHVAVGRPRGKVVAVIARKWRAFCGSIDRKGIRADASVQYVLFCPMDRRIPRIRIRTRQAAQLATQRILVAIDGWDRTSSYPHGHLVRQLGRTGDRATETEAILLEHDVAHADWTPAVLACLPEAGPAWTWTEADMVKRADLRHIDVCSIDPPGCTDIDDALHAIELPNGNYQVGVHIADVTHFVKPNTPLDTEAAARGTTVYLVDRRIDMLPGLLGTNLCSLKSDVDRFAFSCIWEMTPDAHIVSTHFTKSLIRSKASFTYDQAQGRLETPPSATDDSLTLSIRRLNGLAKVLKARRIEAGALTLASPEVRFQLDQETQNPVDVMLKEAKEANSLVEEFMLLANISVAEQLFKHFPDTAILRRHPAPPQDNFEALNRALEARNPEFCLDTTSSKSLALSLDKAIDPADPYLNRLVRIMTTRCMLQAQYFASGAHSYAAFWHYGLACPIYTHFTSPIRRYADVLVHRLLHASIDQDMRGSSINWDKSRGEDLCNSTPAFT